MTPEEIFNEEKKQRKIEFILTKITVLKILLKEAQEELLK